LATHSKVSGASVGWIFSTTTLGGAMGGASAVFSPQPVANNDEQNSSKKVK